MTIQFEVSEEPLEINSPAPVDLSQQDSLQLLSLGGQRGESEQVDDYNAQSTAASFSGFEWNEFDFF